MAPATSIPPALPPSVEEAYRRKCIQLKARTKEVEDANDAARLRLGRLKRQVEKMRLERAFLLEQLAKRTSTNVEDSDGSPSPPPTVRISSPDPSFLSSSVRPRANRRIANNSSPQPKEKPLRIKRGHRKPAIPVDATPSGGKGGGAGTSNLSVVDPASPTSETAISQNRDGETIAADIQSQQNARDGPQLPKKPASAFELYCETARPALAEKSKEEESTTLDIEEELAKGWSALSTDEKDEFEARALVAKEKHEKENDTLAEKAKEPETTAVKSEAVDATTEDTPQATQDEDVKMANYDTDQDTQCEQTEE